MAILSARFWRKHSWNWILRTKYLRYVNFSHDFITDLCKVSVEEKTVKICDSGLSMMYSRIQKVHFDMKMLFLLQTLQTTWRVSLEDSKICKIPKSALWAFLTLHPCSSKWEPSDNWYLLIYLVHGIREGEPGLPIPLRIMASSAMEQKLGRVGFLPNSACKLTE